MFEFEFDQTLFEFAYARPHFEPLFELPPNSHSFDIPIPTNGVIGFSFVTAYLLVNNFVCCSLFLVNYANSLNLCGDTSTTSP